MSKRPFVRLRCAICALALLLLAVGWGYFAISFGRDYRALEGQTQEYAQTAALGLEEHIRRMILGHDLMLLDLAEHLARGEHQVRLQSSLNIWMKHADQLAALVVFDLDQAKTLAEAYRDLPEAKLALPDVTPAAGEISSLQIADDIYRDERGREMVSFFRQVEADERHFLVFGLLQVSCLFDFFQAIELGKQGIVAILHANGSLLAQAPKTAREIGQTLASDADFQNQLKAQAVGSYRFADREPEIPRFIAYRRLGDLPLTIAVGTSGQAALIDWQNRLVDFLLIQVVISLAVLLSTLLVVRNLTSIEQSELKLREREEHFRCVANSAVDAVITVDAEEQVQFWSRGAEGIFSFSEEEVKGRPLANFFLFENEDGGRFSLADLLHGRAACGPGPTFEIQGERKDGWQFPTELSVSAGTAKGKPFYTLIVRDVTERKLMEERIRRMASHDNLTRLPNRGLLIDRLQVAMAQVRRKGGRFALLFLDLDEFKPVNDNYGHEVGDQLLQQVAGRLLTSVRESDTVARVGGDEFAVLLNNIENERAVESACENILSALSREFVAAGVPAKISCSIGVVVYSGQELTPSNLLRDADMAMYVAKRAGKNRYQFVDSR